MSRDGKTGKTTHTGTRKAQREGRRLRTAAQDRLWRAPTTSKKFEVAGTLGSLADLSGVKPWPVDVTAKAGGATVTAKGSIAKPMEAKGVELALSAEGKDLTELGKVAGTSLPAVGAYKVTASLSGPSGNGWSVKDLNLALGKTTVTGQITIDPDKAPLKVTAKLATPELDLAALSAGAPKPAENSNPDLPWVSPSRLPATGACSMRRPCRWKR